MQQIDPLILEFVWCAVPVFNNRETVRKVVSECRDILSRVVVVDDGSTDTDLIELLSGLDVVVLRHAKNLGKGQAILTASHYVEEHGGEYMITIDADGQHLPRDIQKFLPLIREDVPGIIIGCRLFNTDNIPASSRFGRSFANFWLLVETGIFIGDCQSGFRAYPVRYLNRINFKGFHYDFEAEVLAKAAWGGLALTTVDIDVVYPKPEERVSSFKPFMDNLRLTGIHSMLVGRRMLPIRHEKLMLMPQKKGVERKRGNQLGFWIFRTAIKLFGLGGSYGLLYFVGLYYLIVDRPLVAATLAYTRRRFPEHGTSRQILDVYLLFVNQGKSLIDRYAMAAGYSDIVIDIKGYERVKRLTEQRKGFIILTAHVGNWQAAMTALGKFETTVYLMMRPEDNAAVKKTLNIDNEEENIKIISTDDSLNGVIEAMKAIKNGKIVSIMGDRTYGFSAAEATFLGSQVCFPFGAFSLASAMQCPVVVLLSAKTGVKKYLVDISHIIPAPAGMKGKKDGEIKAALQQFADVLQEYVTAYPFQWFAFRDIWQSNE
jgi:predicted LPLAT superfamily acyltransferase